MMVNQGSIYLILMHYSDSVESFLLGVKNMQPITGVVALSSLVLLGLSFVISSLLWEEKTLIWKVVFLTLTILAVIGCFYLTT